MNDADIIEEILERCRRDHHRWLNGDAGGYEFDGEDATLMGGFGGLIVGAAMSTPRQRNAALQFEAGEGEIELVRAGVSGDLAWLVMIERGRVHFRDTDGTTPWELRVTELFERTADGWRRIHRHADPLVNRHPLANLMPFLV
jgi:ketosteroid isomerase-like protein